MEYAEKRSLLPKCRSSTAVEGVNVSHFGDERQKKREKENAESLRNAERNNSLRDKAFLSPEDVSVLFNVSLPTVYRYFQTDLIKAVKIRNKTFVRYSDIERVFDDATSYRKRRYQRKEEQEYYTLREIMEKYNNAGSFSR